MDDIEIEKEKPKAKPQQKKPAEPEEASEPEEEPGVTLAYKVFVEDCQTIDDLKSFWKQNQEELKKLEKSHADLYKEIFQLFSAKKKELS